MDRVTDLKLAATPLHARLQHRWPGEPFVVRVTEDAGAGDRESHCLLSPAVPERSGFRLALCRDGGEQPESGVLLLPSELDHLSSGDILRVNPVRGEIWVMYRRASGFNSILVTERCNSWCVMCSQPPRAANDDFLLDAWFQAIPLMDKETAELGITGGEPTLLGQRFLDLVASCAANLPQTGLHVLTNGRTFNYLSLAKALAAIRHHDLMLGIPLYSDLAWRHDYVVQAERAFDQTIRGILNLARCGVRVEIRIVVHRHTVERLVPLCEFIARNLPFVQHVALMGMEPIGFGRTNFDSLWIDPVEYQAQLKAGVSALRDHRLNVSVYNHQLCVLPHQLWPYARQSISDWKNVYLPECAQCEVQPECAGFFHSAVNAHSRAIRPIRLDELSNEPSTRSSSC